MSTDVLKILSTIKGLADSTYQLLEQTFCDVGITDNTKGDVRMDICKQCDAYNNSTSQCRHCGCYMPIKTKIDAAKCPMSKW
jgi:hypothetical protein